MSGRLLVVALSAAEVLTMAGVFAFPALLPTFVAEWDLTKTEAGWIAGVYFGAYALTAPPALALTDRLDARWVHFGGALRRPAASRCSRRASGRRCCSEHWGAPRSRPPTCRACAR